ncbi:MAG: hypothetical protein ACXADW_18320, partial [Candidatus Hodarchaeales archaeon]
PICQCCFSFGRCTRKFCSICNWGDYDIKSFLKTPALWKLAGRQSLKTMHEKETKLLCVGKFLTIWKLYIERLVESTRIWFHVSYGNTVIN